MDIISYSLASEAQTKANEGVTKANAADVKAQDAHTKISAIYVPKLTQLTKLSVVGSSTTPAVISVPITVPEDFNVAEPTVFKFEPFGQTSTQTVASFTNAEATDFQDQAGMVIFNGVMKYATMITKAMAADTTWTEGGTLLKHTIDKSKFKSIHSVEVV